MIEPRSTIRYQRTLHVSTLVANSTSKSASSHKTESVSECVLVCVVHVYTLYKYMCIYMYLCMCVYKTLFLHSCRCTMRGHTLSIPARSRRRGVITNL